MLKVLLLLQQSLENMSDTTTRQVSFEQVKTMLEFMSQHVDLATGSMRTVEQRHMSKKLWTDLAATLNSFRGARKSADGWSKHWSDFKNRLKNKIVLLNKKTKSASLKRGIKPLTKVEKRALVILGPHFDKKTVTDTYNSRQTDMHPEVKLEVYHENIDSETTDRMSDANGNSEESEESSHEEFEEEPTAADPSLSHNLYPKWLIEVEQKRAEAEITRAKAEDKRATVAAKNAEAALQQAEALNKMAEAAHIQADALVRIAVMLETRLNRDDVLPI